MHEGSFEADTLDLVHRILFMVSRPNKLSHNCLYQELDTCAYLCVQSCLMPETAGQRKLRLTTERLVSELNHRTTNCQAQLREQEGNRSTDVETKATQCSDRAPCLYACLFCFWLLVVNLLLAQWLYVKGHLKLDKIVQQSTLLLKDCHVTKLLQTTIWN